MAQKGAGFVRTKPQIPIKPCGKTATRNYSEVARDEFSAAVFQLEIPSVSLSDGTLGRDSPHSEPLTPSNDPKGGKFRAHQTTTF